MKKWYFAVINVLLFAVFFDATVHAIHYGLTCQKVSYGLDWYRIYVDFDWINANWGSLRVVDWSFRLQNLVMCFFILIRTGHSLFQRNWLHQTVALMAFLSGALIPTTLSSSNDVVLFVATFLVLTANVVGILSLVSLNRSFGILIAKRAIKTDYIYKFVRHPMYFSDILVRIGFVIANFSLLNFSLCVVSISLYVCRAILEEKFLSQDATYLAYCNKVKYRFIPGVF